MPRIRSFGSDSPDEKPSGYSPRAARIFCFDEHRRGSLEAGKLADLAVLSDDLMSVPEDEVPTLSSLLTMVGGKVVHRSGGL